MDVCESSLDDTSRSVLVVYVELLKTDVVTIDLDLLLTFLLTKCNHVLNTEVVD